LQNVALRPFLASFIAPNDVTNVPEPKCNPVHLKLMRETLGIKAVGSSHRVATPHSRTPVVDNFVHGGILAINHRPGRVAMDKPRTYPCGVTSADHALGRQVTRQVT
jgi:hypothetical protein